MRTYPASFGDTMVLHVQLREIEPAIWRRLRVPAEISLGTLDAVLQLAFGWKTYHLHDFTVGEVRFGMVDIEDELLAVDEHAAPLGAVARVGSTFVYRYDFGDDWHHDVRVEQVEERTNDFALVCTDGARACPPEDCGGVTGYQELLEALANPAHAEHVEMKRWVGRGFDPEKFNREVVNKRLATLARRCAPKRRRA